MQHPEWRPAFHLAPPRGWMNDPNGLCQFKGVYHAFYQYSPDWPENDLRSWGHATSTDLLSWRDEGQALAPDIPEDRSGVYSGCAYITPEGEMALYYTGNVIHAGSFDYVHEGREANEILVTSADGRSFSEKRVLLRNEDYPVDCTQHVRDPKVWAERGSLWMVLGARNLSDQGQVLVYRSDDGIAWRHHHTLRSRDAFGYMWECPNVVQLAGRDFLAVCPQGLESEELRFHNRWQSGYFPLECALIDTHLVDQRSFVEWDFGWDFYAPQVFADESGRQILIGWMGSFDKEWTAAPDGLGWCHCLSVPRELTVGEDGLLRQMPVHELEALRGEEHAFETGAALDSRSADIELAGIAGAGSIVLDDVLQIELRDDALRVRFFDDACAAGRTRRTVPLPEPARELRVLVDASCVEIFVDGGRTVFSTRWFPSSKQLSIRSDIAAERSAAYALASAIL